MRKNHLFLGCLLFIIPQVSLFASVNLQEILSPSVTWEQKFIKDHHIQSRTTYYTVKGKPEYKSALETYNVSRLLLRKISYSADGAISGEYIYDYDETGRITHIEFKTEKASSSCNIDLVYNPAGGISIIKGTMEGAPLKWNPAVNQLSYTSDAGYAVTFTFNGAGKIIKEVKNSKEKDDILDDDGTTTYTYYKNGLPHLIKFTQEGGDHSIEYTSFTYNDGGLLVTDSFSSSNQYTDHSEQTVYKYSNGVITEIDHLADDTNGLFEKCDFIIDSNGLLISMTDAGAGDDAGETYNTSRWEYSFFGH